MRKQWPNPSGKTLADDARLSALMRRSLRGDEAAYRSFLSEISGRLRRQMTARAAGLSSADIEDLVQEVLISVHRSRATWDPSKPILPWIAAIARYRLADHQRRSARINRVSDETARLAETFSTLHPNNTSEEVVSGMSMRVALNDLTKTEREAFSLVRLRGMSLDEAASTSGSTVGAVKVAVHRAARKLQALVRSGRL